MVNLIVGVFGKELYMGLTAEDILNVSHNISNWLYVDNPQAVKELIKLFDVIYASGKYGFLHEKPLNTWEDYVRMYDDNFYTYQTWQELVDSEKDQNDGLTEEELKSEIGNTVWQLPCGWYLQYV